MGREQHRNDSHPVCRNRLGRFVRAEPAFSSNVTAGTGKGIAWRLATSFASARTGDSAGGTKAGTGDDITAGVGVEDVRWSFDTSRELATRISRLAWLRAEHLSLSRASTCD
jgi:hypothetical protein